MELVDLQMVPEKKPQEIEIGPNDISIDLLRAIYRANHLPLHTRMRAAMAALKHEVPALIATAVVNEGSFAEILDRRLARLKQIEAKPVNGEPVISEPTSKPEPEPAPQLKPSLPRLCDKRMYRRF